MSQSHHVKLRMGGKICTHQSSHRCGVTPVLMGWQCGAHGVLQCSFLKGFGAHTAWTCLSYCAACLLVAFHVQISKPTPQVSFHGLVVTFPGVLLNG